MTKLKPRGSDEEPIANGNPISEMYSMWTLDCIVDVAYAVALDFVNQPRHYRRVLEKDAQRLVVLKAGTGSLPDLPDTDQRAAIFDAFLGSSDAMPGNKANDQFHIASGALREAAAAFAERVYDTGVPMLRQRVRDAVITLRAFLSTMQGSAITSGYGQTKAIFDVSKGIFAAKEIAARFGLPAAPGEDWPLSDNFDGDGAYLLEEISRVLQPDHTGQMSARRFTVLQRTAWYGKQTIDDALDDSNGWEEDEKIDRLIRKAYSWSAALKDLGKS